MSKFGIKIFADGANLEEMIEQNENPIIDGFTTNPAILRKAGVKNYEEFAKEVLKYVNKKPISFEVIADDYDEMYRQAMKISEWGNNIYVKIPIVNSKGISSYNLIRKLATKEVKVNATCIMTYEQVCLVSEALRDYAPSVISVFCGRIADTLRDPFDTMKESKDMMRFYPRQELLWASPREILNLRDAIITDADIITLSSDLIKKLNLVDKDLDEYSRETSEMFYNDAVKSGYV